MVPHPTIKTNLKSIHTSNSCLNQSRPSRFRPCVGAIIFNKQGRLLCGKRLDIAYWQFPQGGMHPEEDPIVAALREVHEEIGLYKTQLKIVHDRHVGQEKYTYHIPIKKDGVEYDGQEQRYVLFRWDGDLSTCNLHPGPEPPEFSELAWLSWEELIRSSVPTRTFIYACLRNTIKPLIAENLRKDRGVNFTTTRALPVLPTYHFLSRIGTQLHFEY